MLSLYRSTLNAYSDSSPSWYKEFHNIYYMSQLTNSILLSYMDSYIERISKDIIVSELKEYLVENKIATFTEKEGNTEVTILKNDELKSIDIEDFLEQIISELLQNQDERFLTALQCVGVEPSCDISKNVSVDINELLKTTNGKNWYDVIKGFLNIWEYMFLYSITETTLKKVLNIVGQTKEEELLNALIKKYPVLEMRLESSLALDKKAIDAMWSLFTVFRNVYSHSHGIMTMNAKNNIGDKANTLKTQLTGKLPLITFVEAEKLFRKDQLVRDKFYLMKDNELNLLRNFILILMETLEKVCLEDSQGQY